MYYYNNSDGRIGIECDGCGKVYKFSKDYFSNITPNSCVNKVNLECPNCNNLIQANTKIESKYGSISSRNSSSSNNSVKCPSCRSTQITANTKGFGLGKAAVGAVLLGPIGLLGGVLGSKKVIITCLNCGHRWSR